ncbi:MAG: hypothetical protein J1F66_01785 [Clostridiales bacterium]|nr:hypothetical protein [Clostridiales bacterium]
MELKDRKATNPGRVKLRNVSTGAETTYDLTLADNPTEQGTPITKQTLEALKAEILDEVQAKLNEVFVLSGTTLTIKI